MDTKVTNEERLAAAHAALSDAVAKIATGEDWQKLLHISGSFHRYSPNNQLPLAAQGAEGVVASFYTWKQVPAMDGNVDPLVREPPPPRRLRIGRGLRCLTISIHHGPPDLIVRSTQSSDQGRTT
jgi:hypothetical protein